MAASDLARRRIERDLHDGVQQRLVCLDLTLRRTVEEEVPAECRRTRFRFSEVVRDLRDALTDLQEASRGIHPVVLTKGGLGPAIRMLAARSPVPVELYVRVPERLPEATEVTAYYVVSEALANAAKHANASVVRIRATVHADRLCLSVRDDGAGGVDLRSGSGLLGLVDRVESTGGTIGVSGPAGGGTSLRVDLPVAPAMDPPAFPRTGR